MTLQGRSLTFFDSLFYRYRVGPVVARVRLRGPLDATVMDRAARLLRRDHTLLRCSFREAGEEVTLVPAEEVSGLTVAETGPNTLADELNMPLGKDRPAVRISLFQDGDSTVLNLAGDHAGSDARLNMVLLHRLLDYYTDLIDGVQPTPAEATAFGGSLEEALLATFEAGPIPPLEPTEPPLSLAGEADGPGPLGVHSFNYGLDATTALISAARQAGVSVTELLSGALACAVRAQFADDAGPLPVAPAFAVDLRPRVDPPIPADAPFCCVSRAVCSTAVDADDKAAEVGARIGTQLRAALNRNEIQHRLLAQREVRKPAPLPPISFLVSNIGIVEGYRLPEGLRIADSRFATTSRGPVPTLFGSTTDGRLNLDLVYDTAFHGEDVIDEVAKHFEASLIAARD